VHSKFQTVSVGLFELVMAALRRRCRHSAYIFCPVVSPIFFFPRLFSPSQIGCLPDFHTWWA